MTEEIEPVVGKKLSKKKQAAFSIVVFMSALLVMEGALRVLKIPADPSDLREDGGLVRDSVSAIGHEYTPGWKGWHLGAIVHINSAGWRGGEFSAQKPAGTIRLLGIGDSLTFGQGVSDEDVWLERLEQMLNSEPGPRYETINSGQEGASTVQEFRYFREREMMSLAPDLVVLGFTVHNDAQREKNRVLNRRYRRRVSLPLRISESDWYRPMARRSRIARLLQTGVQWAYRDELTEIYYNVILSNYADDSKSWHACRTALMGFYEACRSYNTPLIIVLFPIYSKDLGHTFKEYPEDFKKIHDKLRSVFAGKDGVSVVDVVDDLAATGLTIREMRVPVDGHPNRIWHEIVARRLCETIKGMTLKPAAR